MIETLLLLTGIVVWAAIGAIATLALPIVPLFTVGWIAFQIKEWIQHTYFDPYYEPSEWPQIKSDQPKRAWVYKQMVNVRNMCYKTMLWYGGVLDYNVLTGETEQWL